jgi:uncharacterized BrkB/YihY/UPF0761 family membrane protein
MIYLCAIAFLAMSHLIYRMGNRGKKIPRLLEKLVVLIAAVLSLVALLDLGTVASSVLSVEGNESTKWFPEIFVYPVALILFLVVVFVGLPKPIPRDEDVAGGN